MSENRRIRKVITARPTTEGAGVHLNRVIGFGDPELTDPFLLLDDFRSDTPEHYRKGFPWHPHRGIETITYVLAGEVEHGDSTGNSGVIAAGDVQWMTAGSGIMHQEMPQASERMLGLQLWLNIPAKDKMTPPKYHDIRNEDVREVQEEGAVVRVIAGDYKGTSGIMSGDHVQMTMLEIKLQPGASFQMDTPREDTLFVYAFSGSGLYGPDSREESARQAILFTPGDEVGFTAGPEGLHAVLFMAKPLKEPIAWGGPIVMNTREELMKAFDELDAGTFIKV